MLKNYVRILLFNVIYPLPDNKEAPKGLIVLYVGLLVVDELIWVKKALQDRACSTNSNAELLWGVYKASN